MKTFLDHLYGVYNLVENKVENPLKFDLNDHDDADRELFFINHAPKTDKTHELAAISDYANESSFINKSLWFNPKGNSQINELSDNISKGLKSAPAAKEDFHVYTGINGNKNKMTKGDLHIPAFTSTSTSPIIAGRFVRPSFNRHTIEYHPDEDGIMAPHSVHHIIKIHVKKGQQVGAYIADHSFAPHEKEFLIDKGHTIHLTGEHEDHHNAPMEGWSGQKLRRIYRIHHATITPDKR